jgi:hypothetical protein
MPFEKKGKYYRERQRPPSIFEKGSFRTIVQGTHRIIIGHLKRDGIAVQTILHPLSEGRKLKRRRRKR